MEKYLTIAIGNDSRGIIAYFSGEKERYCCYGSTREAAVGKLIIEYGRMINAVRILEDSPSKQI
jgi:hypothetical protein